MKPWLKLGSVAMTLALLAACSSGIQTPEAESALEPQADGSEYRRILVSSDDAEEAQSGFVSVDSPDLDLGLSKTGNPTTVGLRFDDLVIPQGATITEAYVSFIPAETRSTAATFTFRGQGTSDTGTFSAVTNDLSRRPLTSASVTWNAPAWTASTTFPDNGSGRSANLKDIVQEVVSRSGWASGNSIAFFITGTGKRLAHSFESTGKSPALFVKYTTATPPTPTYHPLAMRGDPNFSTSSLNIGNWYTDFKKAITASEGYDSDFYNPIRLAKTGDNREYGRWLNWYVAHLLNVFRVTGDMELLKKIDTYMELAYGTLRDTNGDGYKNWRYRVATTCNNESPTDKPGCEKLRLTDNGEMEEMLAHSTVASAAYALHLSRDLNPIYGQHADKWRIYLVNHFEAKWRKRNGVSSASSEPFPFMWHGLMHPTANFIRYHYYMSKLMAASPNSSDRSRAGQYEVEALRLATTVKGLLKSSSTSQGSVFVWPHSVKSPGLCQSTGYGSYTQLAILELALDGFAPFASDSYMAKLARTFTSLIYDNTVTPTSLGSNVFADDVCGGKTREEYTASPGRNSLASYIEGPWSAMTAFDATSEMQSLNAKAWSIVGSDSYKISVPAGEVFGRLYKQKNYQVTR